MLQAFPEKYADKVKNKEEFKMSNWENFELECTKYLNKTFGEYATFIHQGGTDSTVPDILVKTNAGERFYIDAKMPQAQCGQFVLLPNIETHSFDYSKLNANKINVYAEKIMAFMNLSFDKFRTAGTAGKDIEMDSDIFCGWIIQTYKEKGAKYFITGEHTILPIERFSHYFDVTAKYRIKRSGSGNVGKSRLQPVMDYIGSSNYPIGGLRVKGNKLFVTGDKSLHNSRFILCGTEYMFSLRGSEYEIRKLSNTYNANVIFSISQKAMDGISNEDFINDLK